LESTVLFWWESLKERDHLKDVSMKGRTALKGILKKRVGRLRVDSSGSGWRQVAGCEHGNEMLVAKNSENFWNS
jgi:hypothetical protein